MWRAAPDGNFDYVNKRMLDILGAPLAAIGWGWMDEVPIPEQHGEFKKLRMHSKSQNPKAFTMSYAEFAGADQRYRSFEVHGEDHCEPAMARCLSTAS